MITLALAFIFGAVVGAAITGTAGERGIRPMSRFKQVTWSSRRRKVLSVTAMLFTSAGVAFAAWFVMALGNGATMLGSLSQPSVSPGSTAGTALFPGTSGPLKFSIDNGNSGGLKITRAEAISGNPGSSNAQSVCPHSLVSVNTLTGLDIPVPPGPNPSVSIPDLVTLDPSAPTECQGIHIEKGVVLTFSTP